MACNQDVLAHGGKTSSVLPTLLFDSGERSGDVGEGRDVERSDTATSVVEGVGAFSFSLYLFTSHTSSKQADPPIIGP